MLIYQEDTGRGNIGRLPSGGVIGFNTIASSMSVAIANPITFYGGAVVSQVGQSRDLYNYYWTSYSRGTDGRHDISINAHNHYLDSYIPLRHKSIYDPCPYGYRIPSNGTYNQFTANKGWTWGSYVGGLVWKLSWLPAAGWSTIWFEYSGSWSFYTLSTTDSDTSAITLGYNAKRSIYITGCKWGKSFAVSVRCIEECELLASLQPQQTQTHR